MASYVRGKYATATCAFSDHLKGMGVKAAVGYNTPPKNNVLVVMLYDPKDEPKVPEEWNGFTIRVINEAGKALPRSSRKDEENA